MQKLRVSNENLIGKRRQYEHELQQDCINLPNSVEVCYFYISIASCCLSCFDFSIFHGFFLNCEGMSHVTTQVRWRARRAEKLRDARARRARKWALFRSRAKHCRACRSRAARARSSRSIDSATRTSWYVIACIYTMHIQMVEGYPRIIFLPSLLLRILSV